MLRKFDTPFGKYFVEVCDGLIRQAYFDEFDGHSHELKTSDQLMTELHHYSSSLQLQPTGTPFQLKVWKYIGGVTSGKIATYKEIAYGLGYPSAVRAVASAISRNPIAHLIPCHRIVRSNGETGGYRWNSSRKKMLLNYESIQSTFHSR